MREHVNMGPSRRVARYLAVCVCAAAYAWWATGIRPFGRSADVAIAIPAALLVVAAWWQPAPLGAGTGGLGETRAGESTPRHGALLWVVLGLAAVGLEVAGLALGGRSRSVPTLSTVADQALAWHATRWLVFLLWLAAGGWPLRQALRRRQRRDTTGQPAT
jgi:hypothetical protein